MNKKNFSIRRRRSLLFIPGIRPDFFKNVPNLNCDAIILDLEDSVADTHKDVARSNICELLMKTDFGDTELIVRINNPNSKHYRDDIDMLREVMPHSIMLPKVESEDEILHLDWDITSSEEKQNIKQKTDILPRIETSIGFNAREKIVNSCDRVTSIGFGAEDLSADLRIERVPMKNNPVLTHVMIELIFLARAAGIDYIDSVFPWFRNADDLEQFEEECLYAKHMGAVGKMLIHPNHVDICNRAFTPTKDEIDYAEKSLNKLEKAAKSGLGAAIVDNRMIDAPQIKIARALIARAKLLGVDYKNK